MTRTKRSCGLRLPELRSCIAVARLEADPQAHPHAGGIVGAGVRHQEVAAKTASQEDALHFQRRRDLSPAALRPDARPALPRPAGILSCGAMEAGVSYQPQPVVGDDASGRLRPEVCHPPDDLLRHARGERVGGPCGIVYLRELGELGFWTPGLLFPERPEADAPLSQALP